MIHWWFFEDLNSVLAARIENPGYAATFFVLALYFVYVGSLFFIGRLKADDAVGDNNQWAKVLFVGPSICFGIIVGAALAEALGFSVAISPVSDEWQAAAFTGFTLILATHVFMRVMTGTPRYSSDEARYFVYLVPTVLIAEVMLNFGMVLWNVFVGPSRGVSVQDGSPLLSFLIAAPFFYFFFAAPRFAFMHKNFSWLTFLSGLGLAFLELWKQVAKNPWL